MNRSFLRPSGAAGGDRRRRRAPGGRPLKMSALAVLSGAVATAGLMLPAEAAVQDPHTVFVLKNDSIVEVEGLVPGEDTLVQVLRNGVVVGSVDQPASNPGGTLIINHDLCWDNFTPEILPGDTVRVTTAQGVDTVRVRNISADEGPTPAGAGSFTIRGTITPRVPVGQLQVEARGDTPGGVRFRPLAPNLDPDPDEVRGQIAYDAATGGAFTATFTGLNADQDAAIAQETLGEFNVAHVAGTSAGGDLKEVTMATTGSPVPGPGCALDAPLARHAVTSLSHSVINRTNRGRNLVVSGMTLDATRVNVRLRDADGTVVQRAANVTGAAGPQTWRTTFTPFQMRNLNGRITVSGEYASGGATLSGSTMAMTKDLVSPKPPRASLRPGVYPRRQFITLDAGPGARIRYTLGRGQAAPTATRGNLYRGQQIAITASQTLKMRAVDQAGNVSPVVSKRYVIGRGPSAPRISTARSGAPGGRATAVARWRKPALRPAQVTGYRVTALKLRRNGSVARRIGSGAVRASSSRLVMRLPRGRYQFRVKAVGGPSSARSNVVRSR
jgi:hypothetical protein